MLQTKDPKTGCWASFLLAEVPLALGLALSKNDSSIPKSLANQIRVLIFFIHTFALPFALLPGSRLEEPALVSGAIARPSVVARDLFGCLAPVGMG